MTVSLVTLGTGTVSPHAERTSAAYWVEAVGQTGGRSDGHARPTDRPTARLLMDCGAGTCHRLAKFGLPWQTITHIAITHFHADHIGELPALIFAMKYGAMEHRAAPLTIFGPVGMRAKMAAFAAAFGDWVTEPGFPLEICELEPESLSRRPPPASLVTGITLSAFKTPHTPESLAFSVQTPEGRLVYTGDTGPSDDLGDWARGCDLLLAECSLPDRLAMDIHLTPTTAGALARRAEAKRLVLTHLYPPVETEDIGTLVGKVYGGPTVVARDGDRYQVSCE